MAEYTYADVIIDPNDPRVEIGAEYFFGKNPGEAISNANADDVAHLAGLEDSDNARFNPFFIDDYYYPCIIRKKEPKYVPFDLSKEEDRARLRGAWIMIKDASFLEYQITSMNEEYAFVATSRNGLPPEDLLRSYEFVDGSPCGRLVEED